MSLSTFSETAQLISRYLATSGYSLTESADGRIELTDGVAVATVDANKFLKALQSSGRAADILKNTKTNPADQTLRRWALELGVSTRRGNRKRLYCEIRADVLLAAEIATTV